jgi:hypothetical protein
MGANLSSTFSFILSIRDLLSTLCKTYSHLKPSMNTQDKIDIPAASSAKGCTPVERRLISCVRILYLALLHGSLAIVIRLRTSDSPYFSFFVTAARILIAASSVLLHQYLTGEWSMNSFFNQTALGILGMFLANSATG